MNAISTHFISTNDARKQVATLISVISAIFVALQEELQWRVLAEKYENVSRMYAMLASQAYGKMTEEEISLEEVSIEIGREKVIEFADYRGQTL